MENRHLQMVLSEKGFYEGGIDGILGPMSRAAISSAQSHYRSKYSFNPSRSSDKRLRTAVLQACLDDLGYEPGLIDGWWGVHTEEALNAFLYKKQNGSNEVIKRDPKGTLGSANIPTQGEVNRVYGDPETQVPSRLVTIELPFTLTIAWGMHPKTRKVTVHRDCADQLRSALIAVRDHYGPARWEELGLHMYGGAYNKRTIRGGTAWSMHAYGCAIDIHPANNGLRTRCPQALFCKPEYTDFLDIMQRHEWLPAIRLWGADAMHFQRARLR